MNQLLPTSETSTVTLSPFSDGAFPINFTKSLSQLPSPTEDAKGAASDWVALKWRERTSSGFWSHEFAGPISADGSATVDARRDFALRLWVHRFVDVLPSQVVLRLFDEITDSLQLLQAPRPAAHRVIRSRATTRSIRPRPEISTEE